MVLVKYKATLEKFFGCGLEELELSENPSIGEVLDEVYIRHIDEIYKDNANKDNWYKNKNLVITVKRKVGMDIFPLSLFATDQNLGQNIEEIVIFPWLTGG